MTPERRGEGASAVKTRWLLNIRSSSSRRTRVRCGSASAMAWSSRLAISMGAAWVSKSRPEPTGAVSTTSASRAAARVSRSAMTITRRPAARV
jgi:hypothetical protein